LTTLWRTSCITFFWIFSLFSISCFIEINQWWWLIILLCNIHSLKMYMFMWC
jgi:hypothetical protein